MKKYAQRMSLSFLKKEMGRSSDASYQKFNILTGESKGNPVSIYHYKISAGPTVPYYHTYINGKLYNGLLSPQEIHTILTEGDRNEGSFSAMRRYWPW